MVINGTVRIEAAKEVERYNVGMLVSDKIVVVDDNICNSASDNYERLWIRVKISDIFINVCVTYFPVEGTDQDLTNDLYNKLLSEVIQLENECNNPQILIMGDFNGRIGDKIYGGDPALNSNGRRLLNFCNDASLDIVNCSRQCHGKITWFRHPYSSCIDYFLSFNILDDYIKKMIVDEERNFHLGSDHNVLFLHLKLNSCDRPKSNVGRGLKHGIFLTIKTGQPIKSQFPIISISGTLPISMT